MPSVFCSVKAEAPFVTVFSSSPILNKLRSVKLASHKNLKKEEVIAVLTEDKFHQEVVWAPTGCYQNGGLSRWWPRGCFQMEFHQWIY